MFYWPKAKCQGFLMIILDFQFTPGCPNFWTRCGEVKCLPFDHFSVLNLKKHDMLHSFHYETFKSKSGKQEKTHKYIF